MAAGDLALSAQNCSSVVYPKVATATLDHSVTSRTGFRPLLAGPLELAPAHGSIRDMRELSRNIPSLNCNLIQYNEKVTLSLASLPSRSRDAVALIARQIRHPRGYLTTIRLTPQGWELIGDIIRRDGITRNQLIARAHRRYGGSLSAALRAYVSALMLQHIVGCERHIAELQAKIARLEKRIAELEAGR